MDTRYQWLAYLGVEAQAMYETKGILEAQPHGSPAVEIVGLPTPYRRPLRPGPCLPDGLPERPLILPGPMWPDGLPVAVLYKQTQAQTCFSRG